MESLCVCSYVYSQLAVSRHKNKKICQVNTKRLTQKGIDLTRNYIQKAFISLFGTSEIRMRYLRYLCGLSLSFAGNKRWAFGVYFFTNIFIIQHHFLFVNTKNKIFNDFFIRYFCNSFAMSSTFRLSPIERCFHFCLSRGQQVARITILLSVDLFFMPVC